MRRRLAASLALGWCVAGFGAAGCGPSFEAIQEGDLRFAHCDRLDLDPNISASHRLHCWREWRRVYTYGQTRDRVEYAQRRIAEVVSGDTDPPFELPSSASRPPEAVGPAEPSPLTVPPPAVVPLGDAPQADDGSAQPSSGDTSGAPNHLGSALRASDAVVGCRSRCEAGRVECTPGCEAQARGCEVCESAFQTCVGDCKSSQK